MLYAFIIILLLIADIQLFLLYRWKIERFEKTSDKSLLKSARRLFAGGACSVMITLAFMVFTAVRFFEGLLSVFSEV